MRLICPNCGAQYAVADDVIPPGGRDVQCSNCAHTWFETPGASEEEAAARTRRPRTQPTNDDDLAPAPQPPADRRRVDPSVADILREEAARETQKRQAETPAAPVESQADLGLTSSPKPPRPRPDPSVAQAAATTAAASVGAVAATTKDTASRKERLPDIEEINSSLESGNDVGSNEIPVGADEARARRGFRRTFILVLLIIAILVAIYVQADAIKAAVPALSGVVDSYVSTVDAGRIWLDDTVRSFVAPAADEATNEG